MVALSVLDKSRTGSKRTQDGVTVLLCMRFEQIDSVDSSTDRIALRDLPECPEPLFVPLLRTGTEDIQWKLVGTGRQERKDQWKRGVHTKQQYNGAQAVNSPDAYANGEKLVNMKQLHAQIAAVSKALTELEASEDKELMQPLESRLKI